MSSQNNEGRDQQRSSDEIDLKEVFASIGRVFSSIGRGIINCILAIRRATFRFATLILVFLILGGAAGFLFVQVNEDYYRAQMVIDSKYYTYELLESIMDNLNEQANIGAYQVLSKKLSLTDEQAAGLRGLSIEPLLFLEEKSNLMSYMRRIQDIDKSFEEEQLDSIRDRLLLNASQYVITTEVYDNGIVPDLESGLIAYLSSNEYVAKRAKVERENLLMMKRSIEEDEQKLSVLKGQLAENYGKISESNRVGSNNLYLGADREAGPKSIFEQSLDLYNQKARINRSLQLNQEVEVVSGISSIEKPASLSVLSNIFLFSLIGLGVAYLVILFIGINKSLNRYEQKREQARRK